MTKREIRKHLRSIRRKVKSTHWIKKHYYRNIQGKDCYCLTGLINVEVGVPSDTTSTDRLAPVWDTIQGEEKEELHTRLVKAVCEAMQIHNPANRLRSIEAWNDHQSTTREDVLAVLDIAIKS